MTTPQAPRTAWWPEAALGVLVLVALAWYAGKAIEESAGSDFRRYYTAGCAAARADNIYAAEGGLRFKYLPFFAQLMSPLAMASEWLAAGGVPGRWDPTDAGRRIGAGIWYAILCSAYLGSLALAVSLCRPQSRAAAGWIALGAVALSLRFFSENVRLGQINMVPMCLALLGCRLVVRGRETPGGILVAVAAAIKFMPIVLVLWFLWRRCWRAAAATLVASVVLVFVAPMATWGGAGSLRLFQSYVGERHELVTGLPSDQASGQSLISMTNRLLRPVDAGSVGHGRALYVNLCELDLWQVKAISVAVVLASICLSLWGLGTRPAAQPALEVALVFLLMILINPEARRAQYITALVPAAALTACYLETRTWRTTLFPMVIAFVLMALSSKGVIGQGAAYDYLNAYGVLLAGALVLFAAVLACLRRSHSPARSG